MTRISPLILFAFVTACTGHGISKPPVGEPFPEPQVVEVPAILAAPPPPAAARTVEQFDTTTEEQRVAAATTSAGGALLGTSVASLGDPSQPGFWAETALVDATTLGRLVYPANGNSVEVELRPNPGGSTRVSLPALRILEAPLTDLPVVEVYSR